MVEEALAGLPGVRGLDIDLARDSFTVRYDARRTGTTDLLDAIRALGYRPTVVASTEPAAPRAGREKLRSSGLPAGLLGVLEQARAAGRGVVLIFHAPG